MHAVWQLGLVCTIFHRLLGAILARIDEVRDVYLMQG